MMVASNRSLVKSPTSETLYTVANAAYIQALFPTAASVCAVDIISAYDVSQSRRAGSSKRRPSQVTQVLESPRHLVDDRPDTNAKVSARAALIKFVFFDGFHIFTGIEYRPLLFTSTLLHSSPFIDDVTLLRTPCNSIAKALLCNQPMCINGILFLTPNHIRLVPDAQRHVEQLPSYSIPNEITAEQDGEPSSSSSSSRRRPFNVTYTSRGRQEETTDFDDLLDATLVAPLRKRPQPSPFRTKSQWPSFYGLVVDAFPLPTTHDINTVWLLECASYQHEASLNLLVRVRPDEPLHRVQCTASQAGVTQNRDGNLEYDTTASAHHFCVTETELYHMRHTTTAMFSYIPNENISLSNNHHTDKGRSRPSSKLSAVHGALIDWDSSSNNLPDDILQALHVFP